MAKRYFYNMILHLRKTGGGMLYALVMDIPQEEREACTQFLHQEYQRECLGYPHTPPLFKAGPAIWAAEVVYAAAQLVLYRQDPPEELESLFPKQPFEPNAENMLSADLCLRFLPAILRELEAINYDDPLIPILRQILDEWHYSGINRYQPKSEVNWDKLLAHPSFRQLYADRTVQYKNKALATIPIINQTIQAAFGIYGDQFWLEFKPLNSHESQRSTQ